MAKNKKKKWTKKRHAFIQKVAKFLMLPFVKWGYHAKITKCKDKRQRLIISNHQTPFDQFFIAYSFKQPVYYVASEDLFSNGFLSKLIRFAVNPIPIKKQTTDVRSVMNCIKVAKEGGSIGIFPEGNRTYSGTTEYMSPAIVKLIKVLKLPLTLYRIEGGYGVQPRWSDDKRKGKMRAYPSKTIEPNEYLALSDEELYELVKNELYVDDREIHETYRSKKSAEYLERALYVCPDCGIARLESCKDKLRCLSCGKQVVYSADKTFTGVGFDFPFESVKQWYDYQADFIRAVPLEKYLETSLFKDMVCPFAVRLHKSKRRLAKEVELAAYGDRFVVNGEIFPFDEISAVTVLGRNKLNIYHHDKVYQMKGSKRFNAIKYVHVYYRRKNLNKGEEYGQFLGL